jgi:hypothetical protein
VISALTLAAALVNPWGIRVWTYAVSLSASPTVRSLLVEWQATSPMTFAPPRTGGGSFAFTPV